MLLITSTVIFLMTGAGGLWGLDQLLVARAKGSRWLRAFV